MIEVLAAIGSIGTVGALAAVIVLALKLSSAHAATDAANARANDLHDELLEMTILRDRAVVQADTRAVQIADLTRAVDAAQKRANDAAADVARETIEHVRAVGVDEAARIVNEMLMTQLGRKTT